MMNNLLLLGSTSVLPSEPFTMTRNRPSLLFILAGFLLTSEQSISSSPDSFFLARITSLSSPPLTSGSFTMPQSLNFLSVFLI
ncbi:hypothetical protein LINPERHAP2_LOCUS35619 [Linum perenne]